jgi:hypothetical protein
MRVVDRIHGTSALVRLPPQPALATGFAEHNVLVFGVTYRSEGRVALPMDAAKLARREANSHVVAVAPLDLNAGSGTPGELCPLTGDQLDSVNDGTDRDKADGHGVAYGGLCIGAADHPGADAETLRGEDIALLAIEVV